MSGIEKLLQVVAQLRNPQGGCPWDLEQDHFSLLPYFFEELHEFKEALESHGVADAESSEELGDLLYQVVLHAQLLQEKGHATFDSIAKRTAEKMRLRHPHVFDPAFPRFQTGAEVTAAWEKIKAHAKKQQASASPRSVAPPATSQLRGVPKSLAALQRAARIGEKASGFDFDWTDAREVLAKVDEELAEFKADFKNENAAKEELGDLLFVIAQLARKRGWDPENVLQLANEKFLGRFAKMEKLLARDGLALEKAGRERLEATWAEVKKS